jgi:hypothetical protein
MLSSAWLMSSGLADVVRLADVDSAWLTLFFGWLIVPDRAQTHC